MLQQLRSACGSLHILHCVSLPSLYSSCNLFSQPCPLPDELLFHFCLIFFFPRHPWYPRQIAIIALKTLHCSCLFMHLPFNLDSNSLRVASMSYSALRHTLYRNASKSLKLLLAQFPCVRECIQLSVTETQPHWVNQIMVWFFSYNKCESRPSKTETLVSPCQNILVSFYLLALLLSNYGCPPHGCLEVTTWLLHRQLPTHIPGRETEGTRRKGQCPNQKSNTFTEILMRLLFKTHWPEP